MPPFTTPFSLLCALCIGAAVSLTAFAQTPPQTPGPAATVEILGFGKEIGELRIVQGSAQETVSIGTLPPGASIPLRGGRIEFQNRVPLPEGGEKWVTVAAANISDPAMSLTAMLIPGRQPDENGHLYSVKIFEKSPTLPPGSYELCNLTPTTLLVQTDLSAPPVEVGAWAQRVFTPKLDRKHRAPLRVAYRVAPNAPWESATIGIVSLPPDRSIRARFVYAASGLGELGDPENIAGLTKPVLVLLNEQVPVASVAAPKF